MFGGLYFLTEFLTNDSKTTKVYVVVFTSYKWPRDVVSHPWLLQLHFRIKQQSKVPGRVWADASRL